LHRGGTEQPQGSCGIPERASDTEPHIGLTGLPNKTNATKTIATNAPTSGIFIFSGILFPLCIF